MVKFILVVITIVFVGLAYYASIDKDKPNVKTVVKKEVLTSTVEQDIVLDETETPSKKRNDNNVISTTKPIVNSKFQDILTIEDNDDDSSSDEEEIQMFEKKIAQEFNEKSQYTGKTYGIDDYLQKEVPFDDSLSEDYKTEDIEEWQKKEISSPPNG